MADNKNPPDLIPGANSTENAIYSKKKMYIHLKHLPSGDEVKFKAMLTQFEDQYTSDWSMDQTLGRMDPIRSFKGTQRIITLGWDVVASSLEEARHNLKNCSLLLSMLYPSYDNGATDPSTAQAADGSKDKQNAENSVLESKENRASNLTGNAATIQGAPLFRLKFANLIQSAKAQGNTSNIQDGLLGGIDGLTYSPDVEQGFFDPSYTGTESTKANSVAKNETPITGILYPQTIRLSFGFYVTHDHSLGWSNNKWRAKGAYPYKEGE